VEKRLGKQGEPAFVGALEGSHVRRTVAGGLGMGYVQHNPNFARVAALAEELNGAPVGKQQVVCRLVCL